MTENRTTTPTYRGPALAGLALALTAIAGCTKPAQPVQEGPGANDPNITVRFSSPDLQDNFRVTFARSRQFEGLTQAEVRLLNLLGREQVIKYQAIWKDKEGFSLDDTGPWRRASPEPNKEAKIQLTAPSPAGRSVTLNLRAPN